MYLAGPANYFVFTPPAVYMYKGNAIVLVTGLLDVTDQLSRWATNALPEVESDLQIVLLKVLLLALLKVFLPKKVLKRVLFKVPLKGVSY